MCVSKTITIDEEAYKILKSRKVAKGESFSDVIKKEISLPAYLMTDKQFKETIASIRGMMLGRRGKKKHAASR